jgi:hypothetical protein
MKRTFSFSRRKYFLSKKVVGSSTGKKRYWTKGKKKIYQKIHFHWVVTWPLRKLILCEGTRKRAASFLWLRRLFFDNIDALVEAKGVFRFSPKVSRLSPKVKRSGRSELLTRGARSESPLVKREASFSHSLSTKGRDDKRLIYDVASI